MFVPERLLDSHQSEGEAGPVGHFSPFLRTVELLIKRALV